VHLTLCGRIDEARAILSIEGLQQWLTDHDATEPAVAFAHMYAPLGIEGPYTVEGIEGRLGYYHGPEKPTGEPYATFVMLDTPIVELMYGAWLVTQQRAWPDVDHVWFEAVDIDTARRTITFHMGS
jgi:hypothetical protein